MGKIDQLVHSLTIGEQRLFTQFARTKGKQSDVQYFLLYKAIAGQTVYNEPLLKKRFGAKLFPQLKQQLQRKIHECLCVAHRNDGTIGEDKNQIALAQILATKGFAKDALEIINKVITSAQSTCQTEVELAAWKVKNNILITTGDDDMETELKRFRQRTPILQAMLCNEMQYEGLLLDVAILKEEWEGVRSASDHNSVVRFIQIPELRNEKLVLCPYSQMIFHYANGVAHYLLGEYNKSENYLLRLVDSSTDLNINVQRFAQLYFKGIANLTLLAIRRRKWVDARKYLERFSQENAGNDQQIRYQIYLLELMLLTQQGKYSAGVKLMGQQLQWTSEFEGSLHYQLLTQEKVYVFFGKISSYFGSGDFKQAAQVMRVMLQQGPSHIKPDAWRIARIVNLILHFSLGNDVLLESELRSVHRMLTNQKTMYRFEKLFLKFIVNIQKSFSRADRIKAFAILHKQLLELEQVPFERNAFLYFDFISWAAKPRLLGNALDEKIEPISTSEFVL